MSIMRRGSVLLDTVSDDGGVEPLSLGVEALALTGGNSVSLLDQLVSPASTYPVLPVILSLQYSRLVSSGYIPITVRVAPLDISEILSSRSIEVYKKLLREEVIVFSW